MVTRHATDAYQENFEFQFKKYLLAKLFKPQPHSNLALSLQQALVLLNLK